MLLLPNLCDQGKDKLRIFVRFSSSFSTSFLVLFCIPLLFLHNRYDTNLNTDMLISLNFFLSRHEIAVKNVLLGISHVYLRIYVVMRL